MKKTLIIILLIVIVVVGLFSTYLLYKLGFFFSAEGRYDDTKLNYMSVLFENKSDIHAFNEGYSESASCPWGFEHNGLDYFFNNDSKVIAAAPGQIWEIENHEGEGNNKYHVRIWIRFNKSTVLGYNFEPWTTKETDRNKQISMFKVKVGDWVQEGEVIAEFLKCNESAHIHFDIIENDNRCCPKKYFSPDGYNLIMELIHVYHPSWELCYP